MIADVVILGAGGDGLVIAECIRHAAAAGMQIKVRGFLDDGTPNGEFGGHPILGRLDEWRKLPDELLFIPAIQKVRDMPRRSRRIDGLEIPRHRWKTVIHPNAVVASSAVLGVGAYVAACATIQPGCRIGDFASLRAGAALGHDVIVERHAYVGPNATMCGRTLLSEGAHLGPNAVVLDGKSVGRFAVVGIGAAVTKDVSEYVVVMGNPARRVGFVRRTDAPRSAT